MNRVLALLILVLLSPLFIVVGLAIFLEDGAPVFFVQKRVGKDYSFFSMYKFRTMKKNTPNVATHLLENSKQYLLGLGGLLRKLSLDELPNLINIVRGEMVFVGPRPALYNQEDLMALRVAAGVEKQMPGITGWAQINGRDNISLEEKVALEKHYLDNQSLALDLKILWQTLFKVAGDTTVSH
ncbi:MAG: sugar transferase [Bacteroidetes bacterium]|nr:sugar transferase [Bacteroidota bacterium]MDA1144903.1 sugar transferase [Bacteroidota bacterium]